MYTQTYIDNTKTVAEGSPPSEVFIDQSIQDMEFLDASTIAYSIMPSQQTESLVVLSLPPTLGLELLI